MIATRTTDEEQAARSICALASALQDLLYYYGAEELSARANTILENAYRSLKAAMGFYFDPTGNPLVYNGAPRGVQFKKRDTVKR